MAKQNGALKKITDRAKKIRRASPNMKWSSAIKQAGRDYRAGKLGAIKILETGEKKSAKPKKIYAANRKANGTYRKFTRIAGVKKRSPKVTVRKESISIGEAKSVIKNSLNDKYKWYQLNLLHCKTKTAKRKIQRKINELKSEMRKQGML